MDNSVKIYIIFGIVILVTGVITYLLLHKKRNCFDPDRMEGLEFEEYCACLLEGAGFYDVEVTAKSGDYGVDILASKDMVTYAIQCKIYSEPVGIKAVQEVYTGRDYYDRMVGAVLTNQYFTRAAINSAQKLKILLWDRDYLQQLIEQNK